MTFNFRIPNLQVIVLILIITIVFGTVFFAYVNAQNIANDQKRITDVVQIQAALKVYFDENGFYPQSSNGIPKDIETYLKFWPVAPKADGGCTEAQNTYTYSQRPGTDYWLSFCLGKNYQNLPAGAHRVGSKQIE